MGVALADNPAGQICYGTRILCESSSEFLLAPSVSKVEWRWALQLLFFLQLKERFSFKLIAFLYQLSVVVPGLIMRLLRSVVVTEAYYEVVTLLRIVVPQIL